MCQRFDLLATCHCEKRSDAAVSRPPGTGLPRPRAPGNDRRGRRSRSAQTRSGADRNPRRRPCARGPVAAAGVGTRGRRCLARTPPGEAAGQIQASSEALHVGQGRPDRRIRAAPDGSRSQRSDSQCQAAGRRQRTPRRRRSRAIESSVRSFLKQVKNSSGTRWPAVAEPVVQQHRGARATAPGCGRAPGPIGVAMRFLSSLACIGEWPTGLPRHGDQENEIP